MTDAHRVVDGPVGVLVLTADSTGMLTGVRFARPGAPGVPASPASGARTRTRRAGTPARIVLDTAAAQLTEYFAGRRRTFTVPLAMDGTVFQQQVWAQLRHVGYGETISYAELARRAGRPGAARAVGHANARNPIAVIVPCHRVVGADGALTGYGGGLGAKRLLLDMEALDTEAHERIRDWHGTAGGDGLRPTRSARPTPVANGGPRAQ